MLRNLFLPTVTGGEAVLQKIEYENLKNVSNYRMLLFVFVFLLMCFAIIRSLCLPVDKLYHDGNLLTA